MASFETRGTSTRAIVRIPGSTKKLTETFDTPKLARNWAHMMEGKLKEKASFIGGTNQELFETYLDAVASKTDSKKFNTLRLMKLCNDPLALLRTADTTTHHINQWIARSLKEPSKCTGKALSGATVNRELTLMSGAFAYALKALHWIKVNPCHGAAKPEEGQPRKRALLKPAEVEALCIATGYIRDPLLLTQTARVGACFLFALETGMRSGEILRLRPEDFWKDKCTAHVSALEPGGRKAAKSGRSQLDPSRNVPLTERAINLLDQLLLRMPVDQPYIVGVKDSLRDALWRKAVKQAGLVDLHFHDMKHEAATRLSPYLDVLALSHAIGTKNVQLLRNTYYNNDAFRSAALLPKQLTPK